MNRLAQGAAALVAATALCLGGAGSTAFWQETTSVGATTFQLGELRLEAGAATWRADGAAIPGDFRAVPGTVLTYTQQFALTLTGDDLTARIALDPGAVTTSAGSSFALSGASLTGPVVRDAEADAWIATESGELTLSLVFTWPRGVDIDDAAQGAGIEIAASRLLVVQAVS